MRLISCYIENFGNIRQRTFDFNGGLTSFCENNGYGKTTIASFLKAMFYGLKQTRATDKELGERARFYPFDGGKFGGNVTFEREGVTYRIERFFGKRSATEDDFKIYKDGEIVSIEDAGKEFFGLDEQSFLRTVFINSSDTESGATGDISRMLNGFIDDADFDDAKKILEKQQKEYRAVKGRGGKIDEKNDEIMRLKGIIDNKEQTNSELNRKYEQRRALAEEVARLETAQNTSRDKNLTLQKWLTYDGILSDAEEESGKLKAIEEKYPAGLPGVEEIEQLKTHAQSLELANERHSLTVFSAEKEQKLDSLSSRFKDGTPTEEEISDYNERVALSIRLDTEIANLEERLKAGGEGKFAVGVPDGDVVKKYGEKLAVLREKRASNKKSGKTARTVALILAIWAVGCAGAGGAFIFYSKLLYGGILLGACALLALASIFTYFKGQLSGMSALPSAGSELENEIRSFLARYGYYTDGGVEVDYNNLVRDMEEYTSGKAEKEKKEALLAEKREEAKGKKEEVKAFLENYGFAGENAQADLTRLGALVAEYAALNAEKEEFNARSLESGADVEKHADAVNEILEKYSIEREENLSVLCARIERDRAECDRLKESIERLENRASEYREDNKLTDRPAEGEEDVHGIDSELSKKREELSLLDREISDDESSVEKLEEYKEELKTAEEEAQALKDKYELITKTLRFLERAEQNLKDRYVSPVRNSFLNYSNLLEKVLGEKVSFDKDFKVRFERGGETRSDEHLSAGQKSLCALCLRLALIDNMYKNEKPFIIMDDPFVHLDKEHMGRAEELLKGLSSGRQIIYFCCHESRNIQV